MPAAPPRLGLAGVGLTTPHKLQGRG